ncbi:hypothetical protein BDR03DRAFT_983659 [Suillus americanus]|nr:hypothetical protein BDR03DRAFT_983659 [Suillus americanus]
MESHKIVLNSLHKAATPLQNCKEARFFAAYSTTAPPIPGIRHRPPLSKSGESTELHERSQGVEVPYAKGKRRNASAREVALAKQKQKMKALHSRKSTASSSQSHKPNVAKPSS